MNNDRLTKWLLWVKVIEADVQNLLIARHVFQEVQKVIEENPRLQTDNSFLRYLLDSYVAYITIGLRRQIKKQRDSISLANLLSELSETPENLTRSYFVSLYTDSRVANFADSDFNQFAAPGSAHIDKDLVKEDLKKLEATTKTCEEFADRRIAHHDKSDPRVLPTHGDVQGCLTLLDKLCVKYRLLFHAQASDTLLPCWQYEWKDIFYFPWIVNAQQGAQPDAGTGGKVTP